MVSRSRTQVRKWSRGISGALVLALAGLLAPATTRAMIDDGGGEEPIEYEDPTPEVIPVQGEAPPWNPSMGMGGHNGAGAPNYYPSGGSSGGGSGGGSIPSGGGTSTEERAIQRRLVVLKNQCTNYGGLWGPATFEDFEINDLVHIGYVCITRPGSNGQREWRYYDSEGILNHTCLGDSEVRVCEGV